jgi:hypothetical protein
VTTEAFLVPRDVSVIVPSTTFQRREALIFSSTNSDDDNESTNARPLLERAMISGVSVSSKGFHVFLNTRKGGLLPLPITRDICDTNRATSPESLTIIQLLSNVDMAGAVLPPETLAKMAIYHCESINQQQQDEDDSSSMKREERDLVEYMKTGLPKECKSKSYKDAHSWFQSRTSLPQITLDQVTLKYNVETRECYCQLQCNLPKDIPSTLKKQTISSTRTLTISVTPESVHPFVYQYNLDTSHIFTSLALALRYKAPIVLESSSSVVADDSSSSYYYYPPSQLQEDFPKRTSLKELQKPSVRITETIERSFEINQLSGALQIAQRLGDEKAAIQIRAKLDDLTTTTTVMETTSSSLPIRSTMTTTNSTDPENSNNNNNNNRFQ